MPCAMQHTVDETMSIVAGLREMYKLGIQLDSKSHFSGSRSVYLYENIYFLYLGVFI